MIQTYESHKIKQEAEPMPHHIKHNLRNYSELVLGSTCMGGRERGKKWQNTFLETSETYAGTVEEGRRRPQATKVAHRM